jgi:hypothetical protein
MINFSNNLPPALKSQMAFFLQIFQLNLACTIWGFHSGDYEECRLLGCGGRLTQNLHSATSQKTTFFKLSMDFSAKLAPTFPYFLNSYMQLLQKVQAWDMRAVWLQLLH